MKYKQLALELSQLILEHGCPSVYLGDKVQCVTDCKNCRSQHLAYTDAKEFLRVFNFLKESEDQGK